MKIILLMTALIISGSIFAQRYPGLDKLVIEVSSPSSMKGTYKVMGTADNACYTWLDGAIGPFWGIQDNTTTAISGKFVMVKDTFGVSITNAADLAGNIAVVYNGGGIKYKQKMINIQAAGAAAMIIIGPADSETYPGGESKSTAVDQAALAINIPMFVIGNTDGLKLAKVMKTDTVNGYVGKTKVYANDLSINKSRVFAPLARTKVTALSQEGDVSETLGLRVKNNGTNTQIMFRARVQIEFNKNIIFRDSIIWRDDSLKLKPKDSTYFFSFINKFEPKNDLTAGEYKVTYSVNFVDTTNYKNFSTESDYKDLLLMEDNSIDNSYSFTFNVADSVYAVSTIKSYTDNYYTKQTYKNVPNWSSPVSLYSSDLAVLGYEQATCIVFSDKNANRIQADGIIFSVFNKQFKPIKDQLVKINVYEWADNFTNILDTVHFGFKNLIPLVDNQEYVIKDTSNWNYENVKFDDPVRFEANKRYLACIHSKDSTVQFGFDKLSVSMEGSYIEYGWQPISPIFLNGKYYVLGWGYTRIPSVAFSVSPNKAGINELEASSNVKVYPNPVSNALNVAFDLENSSEFNLTVTDLSGKVVYNSKSMKGIVGTNIMTIDTKSLTNGMYVLNIVSNNSVVSKKFNVMQ